MAIATPSKRRLARALGPIADLETHLPRDWWKDLFDSVYLLTDGDVVENDANTVHEIDMLIAAVGVTPHDKVLDLCCGQGRHLLELGKRGYTALSGLDSSRYLIRLARRRTVKAGLEIAFHEGDARKFRFREGPFDVVMTMGNSFGYFEQKEDDLVLLGAVARALRPGGTFVLDLTDGDWMRANFEPRSWEWVDQHHFVCRERSLSADRARLISREVVVHSERGVIADQFYAERLYNRDEIETLLGEAGFRNLRVHGTIEAQSTRGQDLGMMANRLFVSATAPRRVEAVRGGRRENLDVAVLMGDPRLPDPVKKNGQFNPEDFETIEKLKDALSELPGYSFRYLDNHATLARDLADRPPALAFNLCDEGFDNDALRELHVPALLETLGIPYSGAGPTCLGLCYDKSLVRAVAEALDVPVPDETFVRPEDHAATLPSVFPALLKPNTGDSSLGITKNSVVSNPDEMVRYLTELRETLPGRAVLVQEFLPGREFSVTLIGNPGYELMSLPISEVDYSGLPKGLPHLLGYESKWLPESPYWTELQYHEADLDLEVQRQLVDYAKRLFERLGCRDYARFDFRTDAAGTIKLLEVNPNPGWCWDGKLNLMAGFAGIEYAEFIRMILDAASMRIVSETSLMESTQAIEVA